MGLEILFSFSGWATKILEKKDFSLQPTLEVTFSSVRDPSSEMHNYINFCEQFQYIKSLMELFLDSYEVINTNVTRHIFKNCKIIHKANHWSLLLFKESRAIHRQKPELNQGANASKNLVTFY